MARKLQISGGQFPFHICGRCNNKEWFNIPMGVVWQIMENQLFLAKHGFQLKIHAFVLMNNHFHLIVSAPLGNLSRAMQFFMSETAREIARAGGRINRVWGARFFRCEIRTDHYFQNAYKYVYSNPVAAGLVHRAEQYPYSTLHGLVGQSQLVIPVESDPLLFDGQFEGNLRWISQTVDKENREAMRKALRRKVFKLPRVNSRPHPLENDAL